MPFMSSFSSELYAQVHSSAMVAAARIDERNDIPRRSPTVELCNANTRKCVFAMALTGIMSASAEPLFPPTGWSHRSHASSAIL